MTRCLRSTPTATTRWTTKWFKLMLTHRKFLYVCRMTFISTQKFDILSFSSKETLVPAQEHRLEWAARVDNYLILNYLRDLKVWHEKWYFWMLLGVWFRGKLMSKPFYRVILRDFTTIIWKFQHFLRVYDMTTRQYSFNINFGPGNIKEFHSTRYSPDVNNWTYLPFWDFFKSNLSNLDVFFHWISPFTELNASY